MLVQEILKSKPTSGVLSLGSTATVAEAAGFLADHRVGAVVVSDDGETMLGILSERDIVRAMAKTGSACLRSLVTELMTTKVMSCTRSDTFDQVLNQMTEGRFRHLPVMEGGKMVGLISIGDVVKARLDQLAMEKEALEGMIMGR